MGRLDVVGQCKSIRLTVKLLRYWNEDESDTYIFSAEDLVPVLEMVPRATGYVLKSQLNMVGSTIKLFLINLELRMPFPGLKDGFKLLLGNFPLCIRTS